MIKICGYTFNDPLAIYDSIDDVPGVYVVFTNNTLLDVKTAKKIGQVIAKKKNEEADWYYHADGYPINIALLQVNDKKERALIKEKLTRSLKPVCCRPDGSL